MPAEVTQLKARRAELRETEGAKETSSGVSLDYADAVGEGCDMALRLSSRC